VSGAALAFVLVVGVIALTPPADRLGVPQPVLLTLFGLGLAFVPVTPELFWLKPELVLPVVLPPLLFAATQRTTAREFREHGGAVLLLAVGLTLATAVLAAVVAHGLGLPWTAAWVLGAIVSPPDPVAATAVARRLRLPHRLVTVLEGEGMFNDATALVAYKVALAAAVTGTLSWSDTVVTLVLAVFVGLAVGFLLGWITRVVLASIHEAYAETTVTILAPFVAYLGAERFGGSGVLAVLVLGLFLRTFGHHAVTSRGWLLGRSVWEYVDYLITSLVFAALGFELVKVIGSSGVAGRTVWLAAAVVGAVVLLRPAWIYPSAWLARRRARRHDYPSPVGWKESAVVSWAGMRGVVTVATALALPRTLDSGAPFAHRHEIVVVALVCVLVTLVVQGLSLAPLVANLGVGGHADDPRELSGLRRRAAAAGLREIHAVASEEVPEQVRDAAVLQYDGFIAAQTALEQARTDVHDEAAAQLQDLLERAAAAERDLVLHARRRGEVSPATADEVLRDIEARALRDLG
jgi:CPA1 family monovalent cation:H+ antiporter